MASTIKGMANPSSLRLSGLSAPVLGLTKNQDTSEERASESPRPKSTPYTFKPRRTRRTANKTRVTEYRMFSHDCTAKRRVPLK